MGELKTGLRLAWRKVSYPPSLRPTTPNQLPSLPRPLKNVMKSKGKLSGLWNCPWICKNCKHGLFTCRASTTEQFRMKCFFFLCSKKKKKGHEFLKYPIQSKGKAKFVWDSTGCYNLFYLSSVEIHSCCTKYSNVDIFKFTHPSHDIRKAEVTVKNQTQEGNVSA